MMVKTLHEETFEYKGIPFILIVEERDVFINPKTNEIRGQNIRERSTGLDSSRGWILCESIVSRIRPDYPYSLPDDKQAEKFEKHHKEYELLEKPKSRFLFGYKTVDREQERSVEELGEITIESLKNAYESCEVNERNIQTP